MKSHLTSRFKKAYQNLPRVISKQADRALELFAKDPFYPGLHFKRVHSNQPIYSIRITRDYRALGVQSKYEVIWFWIGDHSDYEKLLKRLK